MKHKSKDEYYLSKIRELRRENAHFKGRLQASHNNDSKKLPAHIIEKFHNILRDKCGGLWSDERHAMDIVAAFISR